MNNKDKKFILSLFNSEKSEKKILLKNLKKKKSIPHNFFPPMKIINISKNTFSLTNLDIKHTVSIKKHKCNRTPDSTLVTINQTTHTLSNLNNILNNNNCSKNNCNYNDGNDLNPPTIHANGKFKQLKSKIRKRLFDQNLILKNESFNDKLNKRFFFQLNFDNKKKNNLKDNWKGLNISSHYLGNTEDNKFGITSNKLYVNNNSVLISSQSDFKKKQKIYTSPKKRNEFKTINIPKHNAYFNGIGTTNFFPRIESINNNEKLYNQLMTEMTTVFNNKIKEYSTNKTNEKNSNGSSWDINIFRKKLKNMRKPKFLNEDNNGYSGNKTINLSPLMIERNDSFLKDIKNNKTQQTKIRYRTIDVKRSIL